MSAIDPPVCRICNKPHWLREGCDGKPHLKPGDRVLLKGQPDGQNGVRILGKAITTSMPAKRAVKRKTKRKGKKHA